MRSALKLAHARGIALLAASEAGLVRARVRADRDQAGGGGLRPRREAAGRPDGEAAARARRRARRRTTSPMRWRSRSVTCTIRPARSPRPWPATALPPCATARAWRGDTGPRDRASRRHARRKSTGPGRSSTSRASATTCRCRCPRSTCVGEPGRAVTLRVHTHVREDMIALYGFATSLEQDLFERLISISGIGPKLALSVLSGIEPPDLVRAIKAAGRRAADRDPRRRQEDGGTDRPRAEGSSAAVAAGGGRHAEAAGRGRSAARRPALGAA